MVSSLVSVEDTSSAASHIMDSNGCSGVNADGFESLGVYQGEMTGSAANEDFSYRGLVMWPVKPMVSSSLLDEALCAVASHIKVSN
jgi:hypothetical protein